MLTTLKMHELRNFETQYPWLFNLGLSPYTTLCCAQVIQWLEQEPVPNTALHLLQPAGSRITPYVGLAVATWATRQAHMEQTGFEEFNPGDRIAISANGRTIRARYVAAPPNGQLSFSVLRRGSRHEVTEFTIRIDPRLVSRYEGDAGLSKENMVGDLVRQLVNTNTDLDQHLMLGEDRRTYGRANLRNRKPVIAMGQTIAGYQRILDRTNGNGINPWNLIELHGAFIYESEGPTSLLHDIQRLCDVRTRLDNEVLEPLRVNGVGLEAHGLPALPDLTWPEVADYCEQVRGVIGNANNLDAGQSAELNQRLDALVPLPPDEAPLDLGNTSCILFNGYGDFTEPNDSLTELMDCGARIVIVGGMEELVAMTRNTQPNEFMVQKSGRTITEPLHWNDLEIPPLYNPAEYFDNEIASFLGAGRPTVRVIQIPHPYPTDQLIPLRADLWALIINHVHNEDLKRLTAEHLEPVMRYLLHTSGRIPEGTQNWIFGHLETARQQLNNAPILQHVYNAIANVNTLIKAIENVVNCLGMIPADRLKAHFVPPDFRLLSYPDEEVEHQAVGLGRLTVGNDAEENTNIAICGWIRPFKFWLDSVIKESLHLSISIIGSRAELDRWRWAIRSHSHINRREGYWDGRFDDLIPPGVNFQNVTLVEEIAEAHVPAGEELRLDFMDELNSEVRATRPGPGNEGGGPLTDACLLEFVNGKTLAYATNGISRFPIIRRDNWAMLRLSEMRSGDRLVWISDHASNLRHDVFNTIGDEHAQHLNCWRIALQQLNDGPFNGDRPGLAQALSTQEQSIERWLTDLEMYVPNDPTPRQILELAKRHQLWQGNAPQQADLTRTAKLEVMRRRKELSRMLNERLRKLVDLNEPHGHFVFRKLEYHYEILAVLVNETTAVPMPTNQLYQVNE